VNLLKAISFVSYLFSLKELLGLFQMAQLFYVRTPTQAMPVLPSSARVSFEVDLD
jgi:hypothetical protein